MAAVGRAPARRPRVEPRAHDRHAVVERSEAGLGKGRSAHAAEKSYECKGDSVGGRRGVDHCLGLGWGFRVGIFEQALLPNQVSDRRRSVSESLRGAVAVGRRDSFQGNAHGMARPARWASPPHHTSCLTITWVWKALGARGGRTSKWAGRESTIPGGDEGWRRCARWQGGAVTRPPRSAREWSAAGVQRVVGERDAAPSLSRA